MGKVRIHKGCGGAVKNGKCTRCNKKWGKLAGWLSGDIEEKEVTFNERAYKKRIRDGRDL